MFDFRYHAISLAAVFLALVIGILAGVGISGRGFVDDAERDSFNRGSPSSTSSVEAAEELAGTSSSGARRRRQAFVESAYPVLADRPARGQERRGARGRLGRRADARTGSRAAVSSDGGGELVRMRAVNVPIAAPRRSRTPCARDAGYGEYVGESELDDLGRELGRELVDGRRDAALGPAHAGARRGARGQLGRSGGRRRRGSRGRAAAGRDRALPRRALPRARERGEPAVGVEPTRVLQSAIPASQRNGLSTVDGVDTPLGGLALILLLGGAEPGDYGIRDTAEDGILPPIEPLPPPTASG